MTDHKIEEAVRVYLTVGTDEWEIDRTTLDGDPLFSDYDNPLNEACECEDRDDCEAARQEAESVELPTGAELAVKLVKAITALDTGADRTSKAIIAAAGAYRDALATFTTAANQLERLRQEAAESEFGDYSRADDFRHHDYDDAADDALTAAQELLAVLGIESGA